VENTTYEELSDVYHSPNFSGDQIEKNAIGSAMLSSVVGQLVTVLTAPSIVVIFVD